VLGLEGCDFISKLLYLNFVLIISFINIVYKLFYSLTILSSRLQNILASSLLNLLQHYFDSVTLVLLLLSLLSDLLLNECCVFGSTIRRVVAGMTTTIIVVQLDVTSLFWGSLLIACDFIIILITVSGGVGDSL
jgi:hypothetical protein